MIVADNGSNWYLSGAPDERWNNDDLHALGAIPGSNFEVVSTSSLMVNQDSGQARVYSAGATATSTALATPNASEAPGAETPTLTSHNTRAQGQATGDANWLLMFTVAALLGGGLTGLGIWLRARRRRTPAPFK
jgi:hypothetical protein